MSALDLLLADEDRRRAAFPVLAQALPLNHCAVAPLAGPAMQALMDFAQAAGRDQGSADLYRRSDGARAPLARLAGVEPDELALIGPTTLAIALVAEGLPWRPEDEIICHGDDYPANVYPWLNLERRGVVVRRIRPPRLGVITPDLVEVLITPRTRVVALSAAHYLSGHRPDLATIAGRLAHRGILLVVDAIQTLGAFPAPPGDVLAADSHKWLLGPSGAGLLAVRRHVQDRLHPLAIGANNAISPGFVAQESIMLKSGAGRYEPGSPNLPGNLAMRAAAELLVDLDPSAIGARILHLRSILWDGLRRQGWRSMLADLDDSVEADTWRCGILSVRHPQQPAKTAHAALLAQGVIATVRSDRQGDAWLRLAPHAYLHESEMERVLTILAG